jgi:hypothetical protein
MRIGTNTRPTDYESDLYTPRVLSGLGAVIADVERLVGSRDEIAAMAVGDKTTEA